MAKAQAPLSGAYVTLDSYACVAIPIEHIGMLSGVRRLTREYKDNRYVYQLPKEQEISFHIISAESMTAIEVAAKLEEANRESA